MLCYTVEDVSEAAAADAAGEVEPAGHFRVYLGAAPGVGKTYAMLSEGQRRRGRGADVVAGFVEAYGRPHTEELIGGLEVIPRQVVEYRGSRLEEMDLDAILRRRPAITLVDELAHTNVPGSGRHEKRWQDVLDILSVGIDDPAQAIVSFAREHQITQIVVGSIQHSWWHIPGGGPILRQIIHDAGASGIDVHLIGRREPPPDAAPSSSAAEES
jgi:K+-sensing histidine kinase KdpD